MKTYLNFLMLIVQEWLLSFFSIFFPWLIFILYVGLFIGSSEFEIGILGTIFYAFIFSTILGALYFLSFWFSKTFLDKNIFIKNQTGLLLALGIITFISLQQEDIVNLVWYVSENAFHIFPEIISISITYFIFYTVTILLYNFLKDGVVIPFKNIKNFGFSVVIWLLFFCVIFIVFLMFFDDKSYLILVK